MTTSRSRSKDNDIRDLSVQLFGMLSELYHWRWIGNDRFKYIHWKRIAEKIQALEIPIASVEDVYALQAIPGFGDSTIGMLETIWNERYLPHMDRLIVQVELKFESRDDIREEWLHSIVEVKATAMSMGGRSEQSFDELKRSIVEENRIEAAERQANLSYKRVEGSSSGILITGKERKRMVGQVKAEVNPTGRVTRGSTRKRVLEAAFGEADLEDSCAICIENYEDEDELVVLECTHCFHVKCISVWIDKVSDEGKKPRTCPMCRGKIRL